jgi:hypothetical protein
MPTIVRRLRTRTSAKIRRVLNAALREQFEAIVAREEAMDTRIQALRDELAGSVLAITDAMGEIRQGVERTSQLGAAERDRIQDLRLRLQVARGSATYAEAYSSDEPLVTIRIATFNKPETLIDRALASALRQTYANIEVVVVGDHCSEETARAISKVGDSRVTYHNRPFRWPYPVDEKHRWMVAGSVAMNEAANLANGLWIAPLDDDDEFLPDHIETLLALARSGDFELAYGKLHAIGEGLPPGLEVGRFPPDIGQFGFQGAIYPASLRFFEYDPKSWLLEEPGDWNLCRRMLEAGVRIGWIDKVVTRIYPSGLRL